MLLTKQLLCISNRHNNGISLHLCLLIGSSVDHIVLFTVCLICVPLGVVHYTVCSSVGIVVIVSFLCKIAVCHHGLH